MNILWVVLLYTEVFYLSQQLELSVGVINYMYIYHIKTQLFESYATNQLKTSLVRSTH